ncbi:hypothetical protein GC194_10190 [bacterium]|nr:hypothetical protein [bacterium]
MDSKINISSKARTLIGSGFFMLATLLLPAFAPAGQAGQKRYYIVEASSSITIDGKANVADYECAITKHSWGDTITVDFQNDSVCTFSENKLHIPVLSFSCDNEMMTEDFKETLNAEKYPSIKLSVDELVFKCNKPNTTLLKGQLTIAGHSRALVLSCQRSNTPNGMIITGAKKLTFTEFNLVPPEKFFGMVKVEDAITIFFDLHLRAS